MGSSKMHYAGWGILDGVPTWTCGRALHSWAEIACFDQAAQDVVRYVLLFSPLFFHCAHLRRGFHELVHLAWQNFTFAIWVSFRPRESKVISGLVAFLRAGRALAKATLRRQGLFVIFSHLRMGLGIGSAAIEERPYVAHCATEPAARSTRSTARGRAHVLALPVIEPLLSPLSFRVPCI